MEEGLIGFPDIPAPGEPGAEGIPWDRIPTVSHLCHPVPQSRTHTVLSSLFFYFIRKPGNSEVGVGLKVRAYGKTTNSPNNPKKLQKSQYLGLRNSSS